MYSNTTYATIWALYTTVYINTVQHVEQNVRTFEWKKKTYRLVTVQMLRAISRLELLRHVALTMVRICMDCNRHCVHLYEDSTTPWLQLETRRQYESPRPGRPEGLMLTLLTEKQMQSVVCICVMWLTQSWFFFLFDISFFRGVGRERESEIKWVRFYSCTI